MYNYTHNVYTYMYIYYHVCIYVFVYLFICMQSPPRTPWHLCSLRLMLPYAISPSMLCHVYVVSLSTCFYSTTFLCPWYVTSTPVLFQHEFTYVLSISYVFSMSMLCYIYAMSIYTGDFIICHVCVNVMLPLCHVYFNMIYCRF